MPRNNFTSYYLGRLKELGFFNKITDGYIEIDTIKVLPPKPFKYLKPRVVVDKMMPKTTIPPDIKKISLSDLSSMGYVIVSFAVRRNKWFKLQKSRYEILPEEDVMNKKRILDNIPKDHYIEYDRANKLVRLVGRNTRPTGTGKWVRVQN